MNEGEAQRVADYADSVLDLASAEPYAGDHYQSITLCVIDAVYSIGVRFQSVERVINRYCQHFGLTRFRVDSANLPPTNSQQSISELCRKMEEIGIETFANEIFSNKQRTSTKNGILKAEAVYRFATVLKRHNGEYLQDVPGLRADTSLECDIREIPGQRSGISLKAFFMLAGSDDLIKPDRMILRFLHTAIGRIVTLDEAQTLLSQATDYLKPKYPALTPRLFDLVIWDYQRQQGTAK